MHLVVFVLASWKSCRRNKSLLPLAVESVCVTRAASLLWAGVAADRVGWCVIEYTLAFIEEWKEGELGGWVVGWRVSVPIKSRATCQPRTLLGLGDNLSALSLLSFTRPCLHPHPTQRDSYSGGGPRAGWCTYISVENVTQYRSGEGKLLKVKKSRSWCCAASFHS